MRKPEGSPASVEFSKVDCGGTADSQYERRAPARAADRGSRFIRPGKRRRAFDRRRIPQRPALDHSLQGSHTARTGTIVGLLRHLL